MKKKIEKSISFLINVLQTISNKTSVLTTKVSIGEPFCFVVCFYVFSVSFPICQEISLKCFVLSNKPSNLRVYVM